MYSIFTDRHSDMIQVHTISSVLPIQLTAPYTIGHLRHLCNDVLKGVGVEYLSLYCMKGHCQLNDAPVRATEYHLTVHAFPIIRYYMEETGEVREVEVLNPTVHEIYDAFWSSCSEEERDQWFYPIHYRLYIALRERGTLLYYTDDILALRGKEINVSIRYPVEPYELE